MQDVVSGNGRHVFRKVVFGNRVQCLCCHIHSVLLLTQFSHESSGASAIPRLLRSEPSHSLPIFCREDFASHSAGPFTPIDKRDTECGSSQTYRAIEGSPAAHHTSIEELLEVSRTEYRFWVYRNMMSCISERDRAVVLQMLRWVIYAARPLYIWELLDAIKLQLSIKVAASDVKRICGGFLRIAATGGVCLVHSSVQDYLESHSKENATPGRGLVSTTSHEMITKTCLRILDYENLLKNPNTSTVVDLPVITMNSGWLNLYSYARQHWRFHYINAERQSDCLPGLLHEKLRNDWKHGNGIFTSRYDLGRTATNMESRESSISSTVAFLNAVLREGARSGMVRLVKLELEMGASPDAPDSYGITPLHYAAAAGNCEVVKLLMEYGGNANVASNSGDTALSLAVANGRIEAVKMILASGSTSASSRLGTHQNDNRQTSLHAVRQKLSLLVSLSSYCSNCGNIQSRYVVSTTLILIRFKAI
jgi:hypothetical protein